MVFGLKILFFNLVWLTRVGDMGLDDGLCCDMLITVKDMVS